MAANIYLTCANVLIWDVPIVIYTYLRKLCGTIIICFSKRWWIGEEGDGRKVDGRGKYYTVMECIPIEAYLNYLDFFSYSCLLLSVSQHRYPASKIFFYLAE